MSYKSWFLTHSKKHKAIVEKLSHLSDDEIVEYFRYENMVKNEVDFCPLYKENKKCHDMEDLNCYLCACPNFRFDDGAEVKKSHCSIDSKDGKELKTKAGIIHQDCSNCLVPHKEEFIKKRFSKSWLEVMRECYPST